MQIDYSFPVEIKEISEDGTFTGIASVYGVEDLGGDVIDRGAFKKTLNENATVPILWQHNREEVIGEGSLKEWQGKILVEGRLDLEDETAEKAYRKMKKRLVKGLSIGFQTIKSTWEEIEGRMIRHITELKLWEVSVVTFPMLPAAQVTRVKSAEQQAIESRLRELEAQVSALTAKGSPPADAQEPPAVEPPVQSTEPVADHSKLSQLIEQAKENYRWNR